MSVCLLIILLCIELIQFCSKVLTNEVRKYFTRQNITEVVMLTLTISFFFVEYYEENLIQKSGAQEHLLGWALFLAWMDLTIFLARFDVFGLPIYLSWHVFSNVAWNMVVYIPTVIAFSSGFHCFLRRNDVFKGKFSTILKTLAMLLGEMDFEDNFLFNQVEENKDSNFSVQVSWHLLF